MPFVADGLTTGLLGFTLKKEFLSEGLFYRETEVYDYEIYSRSPLDVTDYSDIQNHIRSFFNTHSGNVNVKVLESPAGYFFPDDGVRANRILFQVEVRKPDTNLSTLHSELSGAYYKGLDSTFLNTYGPILNDFKEQFTLENAENGNRVYSHDISFSINSGSKSTAVAIASGIFANDKDTTFGINAMTNQASIADVANFINFYNESFDLLRNTFSFSKKREILPTDSSPYTYSLNHSLNFKEDGIIDVVEKAIIEGKLSYSQAQQGLSDLFAGSYGRCSSFYSDFKNMSAFTTVDDGLINLAISTNKVLNVPSRLINYEVGYTNNRNILTDGISVDKTLTVDLVEGKFIEINHNYNFTYLAVPIPSNLDASFFDALIADAHANSPSEVSSFYTASPFYNSTRPNMQMIRLTSSAPFKRKTGNISMFYSNNPIYFVSFDGTTYPLFDFKINDNKPPDIVNEYKIINRPSKTSLINYAFQTERGERTISITTKLSKTVNTFTSPIASIATELFSLYKFGVQKLMESFVGVTTLSFTYFLSGVKYRFNSENDLVIDITITYVIKKYTA